MTRTLMTVLAAAVLTAPAMAQQTPSREGPKADINGDGQVTIQEFQLTSQLRFDANDLNGDGLLQAEELKQGRLARREARETRRFARLDANGDGAISREEIRAVSDERREARRMRQLKRFDVDGDGRLSDAERQAARAQRAARRDGRPTRGERPRMDADGDGVVTAVEYAAHTDALFARMDANGDGVLTKGEGRRGKDKGKRGR